MLAPFLDSPYDPPLAREKERAPNFKRALTAAAAAVVTTSRANGVIVATSRAFSFRARLLFAPPIKRLDAVLTRCSFNYFAKYYTARSMQLFLARYRYIRLRIYRRGKLNFRFV